MTEPGPKLTERLLVPMSPEMLERIRSYWHEARLNSKSQAVRELIEAGLEAKKAGKVTPTKSK